MAPCQHNDFPEGLMTTESHVIITGGQGFHKGILERHSLAHRSDLPIKRLRIV